MLPLTLVVATAHPGHALLDHGAGHAATSVDHLIVLAGCAALMFAIAQFAQSTLTKKYLRFAGATALLVVALRSFVI